MIRRIQLCFLCFSFLLILTFSSGSLICAGELDREALYSDIPQVVINTETGTGLMLEKTMGELSATISVIDKQGGTYGDLIELPGIVKVRGNSTANAAKKPYTIKFDKKQNVLGLGTGKKWALLANYFDPTLLRNYIALKTAQQFDGLDYTSTCTFVDVWLDGTYLGNYLLTYKPQEGKDRMQLDFDNGDFAFEAASGKSEYSFGSQILNISGKPYELIEPDFFSEDELKEAEGFLLEIVNLLCSEKDINEIKSFVDVDSFVDSYILNELMFNVDFCYKSTIFYVKDKKLFAGPVWDFDLSSGNVELENHVLYNSTVSYEGICGYYSLFYSLLFDYSEFVELVEKRYYELQNVIERIYTSSDGNTSLIDSAVDEYRLSFSRDNSVAGWNISDKNSKYLVKPLPNYDDNVSALKEWFENRNEWLLENIGSFNKNETRIRFYYEVIFFCSFIIFGSLVVVLKKIECKRQGLFRGMVGFLIFIVILGAVTVGFYVEKPDLKSLLDKRKITEQTCSFSIGIEGEPHDGEEDIVGRIRYVKINGKYIPLRKYDDNNWKWHDEWGHMFCSMNASAEYNDITISFDEQIRSLEIGYVAFTYQDKIRITIGSQSVVLDTYSEEWENRSIRFSY